MTQRAADPPAVSGPSTFQQKETKGFVVFASFGSNTRGHSGSARGELPRDAFAHSISDREMKNLFRLLILVVVVGVNATYGPRIVDAIAKGTAAPRKSEAMKEVNSYAQQANKDLQAKLQEGDAVSGSTEKMKEMQEVMARAASKATGDEAIALRVTSRVLGSMQPHMERYERAFSDFNARGGLKPASLTSAPAIDERYALLAAVDAANRSFQVFVNALENQFRTELVREGVSAPEIDQAIPGFLQGINIEAVSAIRNADAEMIVSMGKYLQLLKSEMGKWRINPEGNVVFQNGRAAEDFNGLSKAMAATAARQTELQMGMLRARQGKIGP